MYGRVVFNSVARALDIGARARRDINNYDIAVYGSCDPQDQIHQRCDCSSVDVSAIWCVMKFSGAAEM